MKPHVHAEVIKAWADGAIIECRLMRNADKSWKRIDHPSFQIDWEYRIKPERVFPKTSLTPQQLYRYTFPEIVSPMSNLDYYTTKFQTLANEVIKQYILDTEKDVSAS